MSAGDDLADQIIDQAFGELFDEPLDAFIQSYGSIRHVPWTTMDGRTILLGDMETAHAHNIIDDMKWRIRAMVDQKNRITTFMPNHPTDRTIRQDQVSAMAVTIQGMQTSIAIMRRLITDREEDWGLTKSPALVKMRNRMMQNPSIRNSMRKRSPR